MERGLLVVLSGPAGSGKGTVNAHLIGSGEFAYSVSATTRAPRPGEVDGVNYHFLTRERFEAMLQSGDMLEYTEYCGNYYGTPRAAVEEVLQSGRNLILEIEVDGAEQIKRRIPEAVLIMLLPPSFAVQEARLRGRGTETEEVIQKRLTRTREELKHLGSYDYVVYNHDGKTLECAEDIRRIVAAEKCALSRHPNAAEAYFASRP
jgi:guanylate kinase